MSCRLRRSLTYLLVTLFSSLALAANSSTIYVKWDSPGSALDGQAWTTAYHKIQDGIDVAQEGDEVWVAQGSYSECLTMKSGVTVKGGFCGEGTTRDIKAYTSVICPVPKPAAAVSDAVNACIDGFTITGGSIGISCRYNSTVTSNTITDNNRGVSFSAGSAAVVMNNQVFDNIDYNIQCDSSSPLILGNTIYGSDFGIMIKSGSPTVCGNALTACGTGIALQNGLATIINNTIAETGGRSALLGTGISVTGGKATIANNILAFNATGVSVAQAGSATFSYNDVYGNTTGYSGCTKGATDISVDPQLVATKYCDLHIQDSSPCRNKGNSALVSAVAMDIDGQSRVEGSAVDIGADESYGETYSIPYRQRVVYVDAGAQLGGNGKTWSTAYQTIQAGIDDTKVNGPADIWVAQGVYFEEVRTRTLSHIYGGFCAGDIWADRDPKAHATIIDASKNLSGNGLTGYGACCIDGFTIRIARFGMSCYRFSPTVSTCSITGCTYGFYLNEASPSIDHNELNNNNVAIRIFSGNPSITRNSMRFNSATAVDGNGIGYGTVVVSGNDISCNGCAMDFTRGAACHAVNNFVYRNKIGMQYCSLVMNNTIVDNGAVGVWGCSRISNNIIVGNGTGIGGERTSPQLKNNDVYDNGVDYLSVLSSHAADKSFDPLFASRDSGNLRIQANSPCRDAGNDTEASGAGTYDIDGQQRINGAHIDIGADESYGEAYAEVPVGIVYVNASAPADGDGTSWSKAYQRLSSGLAEAAKNGCDVWVAQGIYGGQDQIPNGVRIYGGFAAGDTKGERNVARKRTILSSTITAGPATLIDGFVVTSGISCPYGANARICNNIFTGCTVAVDSSSPTISHNTFIEAGISSYEGTPRITHNKIYSGRITSDAGSAIITGNTISSYAGYAISCGDASVIANNTISDITSSAIYCFGKCTALIANNIINQCVKGVFSVGTSPTLSHNNIYGSTTADYDPVTLLHPSDISVDPQFASADMADLHIRPGSPCRDAGDGTVAQIGSIDIDGQPRVQGIAVDIGADESHGETYPSPYLPRVLYVDGSASEGGDGSSWATAYRTIQAAMDDIAANGCAEAWVAKGTYTEQVQMPPYARMLGGFCAGDSLLDRDPNTKTTTIAPGTTATGSYAVLASAYVSVDGFVIRGGYCGILRKSYTRDVFTISHNTITEAIVGVSVPSGPNTVTGNIIKDNNTGMLVTYSGVASESLACNNVFTGNSVGFQADGGRVRLINNNLVANATAISHTSGTLIAANNIVASNWIGFSSKYPANAALSHNVVFDNARSSYEPASLGHSSDMEVDPQFFSAEYGDLHISATSPCRDAGDVAAVPLPASDIDGQGRIQGLAVDIGADESYGEALEGPFAARVIYVDAAAAADGDGTSWATAFTGIGMAMQDIAVNGAADVWVAEGSYADSISVRAFSHLFGGFRSGGTLADRAPRALVTSLTGTVTCFTKGSIDGFCVKGSGIVCNNMSPAITNNTIIGCRSGISIYGGAPTITGNRVIGNSEGICSVSGSPRVTNNTIIDNGLYGVSCYPGTGSYAGYPVITNNIIGFNPCGVYNAGANPSLSHNNVYGNWRHDYYPVDLAHQTDISVDPMLASALLGDVRIYANSPCRDAGNNSAPGLPAQDYLGRARVEGSAVDIGAVESDGQEFEFRPNIVYVDRSAPSGGDGSAWDKAFNSIQAGVDSAAAKGGAEVWVAKGNYAETITLQPLTRVLGGFAAGCGLAGRNPTQYKTVIDAGASNTVGTWDYVVIGATASTLDGFAILGKAGIDCRNVSPILTNNIICGTGQGNGVLAQYSAPLISGNRISRKGAGVNCVDSFAVVAGNTMFANGCAAQCQRDSYSTISIPAVVANNTMVESTYGLILQGSNAAVVSNNIVASGSTGIRYYNTSSSATLSHNDVFGNTVADYSPATIGHSTDISANPMFACPAFGDFHLRASSPCRNAGDNAAPCVPLVDMDGEPRPEGTSVDIGADETYGESRVCERNIFYVDSQAPAGGDGRTWQTALRTIQDGVYAAHIAGSGEVWVAKGTYKERVVMHPLVHLYGGFVAGADKRSRNPRQNETIVQSQDYATFYGASLSTIDGFTIKGTFSAVNCDNSSGVVSNNLIVGVGKMTLGVTCNAGSPVIIGNRISGYSTGVSCTYSSGILANNYFTGNTIGIALSTAQAPCNVVNNTIVGNTTGLTCTSGACTVANNIVAFGNTGISAIASSKLSCNNVYGNTIGNYGSASLPHPSDISVDPRFVDRAGGDFHLRSDSQCIDAGVSDFVSLAPLDADGEGRFFGRLVDIGADEYWSAKLSIGDAKRSVDGAAIKGSDVAVTAVFPDFFYVEQTNRANGIRVELLDHSVQQGGLVTVAGNLATNAHGERCITASSVLADGVHSIAPVTMNNRTLGGGRFGLQDAVWSRSGVEWLSSSGLNNIGLLIKTSGRITFWGNGYFYMDDGSGLNDSSGHKGVKVYGSLPGPSEVDLVGKCVIVTGVSSCERVADLLVRVVRTRSVEDVVFATE